MGLVLGTGCFLAAGRFLAAGYLLAPGRFLAAGYLLTPGHLLAAGRFLAPGCFRFYFPFYIRRLYFRVFLRLIAEQINNFCLSQ